MRIVLSLAPLALFMLLPAHPCLAWGVTAHRLVNGLAIDCLPPELKPLYEANRVWITTHSIDPDLWRRDNFAAESPRHFIDLDADGASRARDYPEDYWVAVGIMGKSVVNKRGIVPWRVGEYFGKLVRAFKSHDTRSVVELSTWLGHYVSDVHVPFHATADYDGQSSSQKGIHARFETEMVDKLIHPSDLSARALARMEQPVSMAFQWARTSLALCPEILAADRRAQLKDAAFGYNYLTEFATTARPIAIRRIEDSAKDTASLWWSAWLQAGKPAMPIALDVHAGESLEKPSADPDLPGQPGTPQVR